METFSVPGSLNDEQMDHAQVIRQASEQLLRIPNDILDLSKIEAGKMVLETSVFHLSDLIYESAKLMAPLAH